VDLLSSTASSVRIDPEEVRQCALSEAARIGYSINARLPLPQPLVSLRTLGEIADRILALNCVVAVSFGFPRTQSLEWLRKWGIVNALSRPEEEYLNNQAPAMTSFFRLQVDALWALSWVAGIVRDLDFVGRCDANFVSVLPHLKISESPQPFLDRISLRNPADVAIKRDLAYCLHWAIREARLQGLSSPGVLPAELVIERRRALEWSLSSEDWQDISLDT
jgi:Domain of unknown function (DUF4272)